MTQQNTQAAIGIDIGSFKAIIAVAKKGGIEVITNQANFRQTPVVVGYGPNQRFIGEAGNVKMKTNFKDTVNYPTRFLGLLNDYPLLREQIKFVSAKTVKGELGKLQFVVNYQGRTESLVAEQVVAAFLNKLKNIIAINKLDNKEVVLSVPSYYTQIQRKALLDAAKIAELSVIRLINQSTAIALDYGIFRKSDLDAEKARNILFVDFGHSKFSAFICSFTKDKMTTLVQHHQRNLGCRDIDYIILQFYQQVFFKSSGGCDLFESKKALIKLMDNIERQRKILSANVEYNMNLEYLMEDNDLNYNMKREEFQKLAEPVFQKILKALDAVKNLINKKKINIHSIEMVGGGTRIPLFHKIISNFFKIEPSRTLNSSQSIAKGCALMAAMRSPNFKVADYGLQQINPYSVKIFWNFVQKNHILGVKQTEYPQKNTNLLFPVDAILPITKTFKFTKKQPIELLIVYDPLLDGFGKHIAYYKTSAQHPKEKEFTVVIKIRLNQNGLIVFDENYLEEEYVQKTKKKDEKQKDGKKLRQTPIKLDQSVVVEKNTPKQLDRYLELETKMLNEDRLIFETYDKKNELETILYNNKQRLSSIYKQFVNPNDVQKILIKIEQTSKWLQEDGQSSNKGAYTSKIENLKQLLDPISKRYQQYQQIVTFCEDSSSTFSSYINTLNSQDSKYSHISSEERELGVSQVSRVKTILENAAHSLRKCNKWEQPMITLTDLKKYMNDLHERIKRIMNKPVPKIQEQQKQQQVHQQTELTSKQEQIHPKSD